MAARHSRRESRAALRTRAAEIVRRLHALYPGARCELAHDTPFQLLIGTILSAQCTDALVNRVTPAIFRRWPDAAALARAKPAELEEAIHATGFFRAKARSIQECCRALIERHAGEVPRDRESLQALRGVGRKTASVILGTAFGEPAIAADTHVLRLAARLGLSAGGEDAELVERDLQQALPPESWTLATHLLQWHGRRCCAARKPACERCPVAELCPSG